MNKYLKTHLKYYTHNETRTVFQTHKFFLLNYHKYTTTKFIKNFSILYNDNFYILFYQNCIYRLTIFNHYDIIINYHYKSLDNLLPMREFYEIKHLIYE